MTIRARAIVRLVRQLQAYATLERLTWLDEGRLAACRYPRGEAALGELSRRGVTVLINLHERRHPTAALARYGLAEVHLPVADFTPPTPEQLRRGVVAVERALASGRRVAVHCGAGLGRTGTLLACILVGRGFGPDEAIARVRRSRPGSVETPAQEAAIAAFARLNAPEGNRSAPG